MVGFSLVPYTKPYEVITSPPSLKILPVANALEPVIESIDTEATLARSPTVLKLFISP